MLLPCRIVESRGLRIVPTFFLILPVLQLIQAEGGPSVSSE